MTARTLLRPPPANVAEKFYEIWKDSPSQDRGVCLLGGGPTILGQFLIASALLLAHSPFQEEGVTCWHVQAGPLETHS